MGDLDAVTTHHFLPTSLHTGLLITHTFAGFFHLVNNLVEGRRQDHGRQPAGTEVENGHCEKVAARKEVKPGAKGKGVIFVLVVLSIRCEIICVLGILLIEHIVVNNFSPPVGRILVWIDDAGQGRRFQVVRHLEAITGLKKCLLGKRRWEQGWVHLGDREGVVLKEWVSGQQMSLRRGLGRLLNVLPLSI